MIYLLDTDVMSQPTKPSPHSACSQWLLAQKNEDTCISTISVFEVTCGVALMAPGRKKQTFQLWIDERLRTQFAGRILPVTVEIAKDAGTVFAEAKSVGFNVDFADALIASTARIHGCSIVTLNRKRFQHLQVPLVRF